MRKISARSLRSLRSLVIIYDKFLVPTLPIKALPLPQSLDPRYATAIALVDARKTSLTGVQNSKKIGSPLRGSDIAASRLVDDRWLKPPPWKKARSAPAIYMYVPYAGMS